MKTPAIDLSFQAFQVYPDWWLGNIAIQALTAAGEGCFARLLVLQWKAITLPADPKQLQRLTKASEKEWKRIWPELEPLFPITEDGIGRRNPEQYALYQERVTFIEQKRKAGKLGGRPKNQTPSADKADDQQNGSNGKPYGFDLLNHMGNHNETPKSVSLSGSESTNSPTNGSSSSYGVLLSAESVDHCVLLAAAANRGMSEALGGLQEVVVHSTGWSFLRDCSEARVPLDFALARVYGKARTLNKPIRQLGYFTRFVLEQWEQQQARMQAALYSPAPTDAKSEDGESMLFVSMARREAAKGSAEWVEYCTENGITFERNIVTAEHVA